MVYILQAHSIYLTTLSDTTTKCTAWALPSAPPEPRKVSHLRAQQTFFLLLSWHGAAGDTAWATRSGRASPAKPVPLPLWGVGLTQRQSQPHGHRGVRRPHYEGGRDRPALLPALMAGPGRELCLPPG